MANSYFFDSYALHEILVGNNNYDSYKTKIIIVTTKLNLMELHYIFLKKYDKKIADEVFNKFKDYCVEIDDDIIKCANEFKLLMKRKNLSYIDCIGYTFAKTMNIKFLTGDKEFETLENVEFVK